MVLPCKEDRGPSGTRGLKGDPGDKEPVGI